MGTKNTTSTSTQQLPGYINDAYKSLISSAGQTASQGYTPYTGGFTQDQKTAFGNIGSLAGSSDQAFGNAMGAYNSSMTPTSQTVGSYMSPYMDEVINKAMANMQEQNAQGQQQVVGDAISKGAMGGNRVGVAQSELARQQKLADGQTLSNLYQSGYGTALGAAQADKTAALQAAQGYGNLGQTQMQTNLAQAGSQLGAGTQQQQFDYQQYLNQMAYPYQQQGWLASIVGGLGSTAGGTTTQTTPQGNIFSQLLGAGLGVASLFKDGGRVRQPMAMGGIPYSNDNGEWGSLGSVMSGSPYANDNGDFGSYIPKVAAIGGGGGNFPTIQQPEQQEDPLAKYTSTLKEGAGNIKGWLTPSLDASTVKMPALYAGGGVVGRHGYALGGMPTYPIVDSYGYDPLADRDEGLDIPTGVAPTIESLSPKAAAFPMAYPDKPTGVAPAPAPVAAPTVSPAVAPKAAPVELGIVRGGKPDAASLPRSVRNNNPGNLAASAWTKSQPGYAGSDGRFAIFESPEAGRAAQLGLLDSYAGKGVDTISSIVGRWSPATDGNPTGSYVDYIVRRTGIPANAKLGPDQRQAVADAMAEFEGGSGSSSRLGRGSPVVPGGSAPGTVPYAEGEQFVTTPRDKSYSKNGFEALQSLFGGKGLNLAPDVRNGLLTAGLGMMASRSPFALQGVGEGGLAGVQAWRDYQTMERENAKARADIGQRGEELAQKAIEIGANVGNVNAATAQTDMTTATMQWDFKPTMAGMMVVDKTNPANSQIVPYASLQGWAARNNVDPSAIPGGGAPLTPTITNEGVRFDVQAPDTAKPSSMAMNPDAQGIVIGQTTAALDASRQADQAAQESTLQLSAMRHAAEGLPETGFVAPGQWAETRGQIAKSLNTLASMAGIQLPFNPSEVASIEEMNKLTTQFGFALARTTGSDVASSVISQGVAAVPSIENTPQGFRTITGLIQAGLNRTRDYHNFLEDWANQTGGDLTGAADYFNKAAPPSLYADSAVLASAIVPKTQADIDNAPAGTLFNINGQLMVK